MQIRRALFVAILTAIASGISVEAAEITGRASVVDGDTLDIGGQRIRLNGIDAPESAQTCQDSDGATYRCGKKAAFALDDFLAASRPTRCVEMDRDRYKRVVAVCHRADGTDVNSWLVRQGWAVDWERYSKGKYRVDQQAAQKGRLGIWSGQFETPCVYRALKAGRQPNC
ncbi:thermonuclease family protein [Agrobacterium sp. rho-8.1]|nr:thermonuclease family protein [Agrobacterium sp. rho-8.1]